jgi:hypothetical protein
MSTRRSRRFGAFRARVPDGYHSREALVFTRPQFLTSLAVPLILRQTRGAQPKGPMTLLVVILLHVSPVFAQAIRVTGTSVALAPPPGFEPSNRFPGFERADLQSAVMVTEIPGPVADVSRGMTAAGLATSNAPRSPRPSGWASFRSPPPRVRRASSAPAPERSRSLLRR